MNWIREVKDNLYGDLFTQEIRIILEGFLSKHEKSISSTVPTSEKAKKFIQDLKKELSMAIERLPSKGDGKFIHKLLIQSQNEIFQGADAYHLFRQIQKTLENERKLVQNLRPTSSSQDMEVDDAVSETSYSGEALGLGLETQFNQICQKIDSALIEMGIQSESLCFRLLQQNVLPNEGQDAPGLYEDIGLLLEDLTKNHKLVLSELDNFRDEQRLVSLGKLSDKKLENFEVWFWKLLLVIQEFEEFHIPNLELLSVPQRTFNVVDLQNIKDQIKNLTQSLFKNGCVIEKQPKQIILQGVNFGPIKLRILPCPGPYAREHQYPVQIVSETVTFINEAAAQEIICPTTVGPKQLECLATLKHKSDCGKGNSKTSLVGVKINNIIQYPKISARNLVERSDDAGGRVSKKRFYLSFNVYVTWKGETYNMETLSLPIYYTTHGSQDKYSWTDMVYYNSIPRQYLNGNVTTVGPVPNTIPWNNLIEGIDQLFFGLGRKLSDQQKDFFKQKLCEDGNDTTVSMEMFYDESFGFGGWLYHCWQILSLPPSPSSRLVEDVKPIRDYWANGAILGFLTTEDVIANLKDKDPGTITVRFPEKKEKCIGLYWYSAEKAKATNNESPLLKQLLSIAHLNNLPLQDTILKSKGALYLYSNYKVDEPGRPSVLPKTEVFEASPPRKPKIPDERGYFTTVPKEQEYFPTVLLRELKLSG